MDPRTWEDRTRDVAALADTTATLRSSLGPTGANDLARQTKPPCFVGSDVRIG